MKLVKKASANLRNKKILLKEEIERELFGKMDKIEVTPNKVPN